MMQSAHSPVPTDNNNNSINGIPVGEEEFDDPFKTMSSSNLDDLALSSDNYNNDVSTSGNAAATTEAAEEADPWAVLAAAAGEEAPAPTPPPVQQPTAPSSTPAAAAETAIPAIAPSQVQLAHAEGENFSMPNLNSASQQQQKPSLAAQIQSSTANLTSTLSHKIQEVDAKTGISTKTKSIDEQYHISEKWTDFNQNILKPTTAKTVEKTKEVTGSVKQKVAPTVKEGWGSIKQRSTEMGIAQKWSSLSSVVGSKWHETKEKAGESVEHWKAEQEKKRAMANAGNGQQQTQQQREQQFQQNLEATKEKVVEGWTGGVNWVSQRIQEVKLQQQQQSSSTNNNTMNGTDREMARLDSDGLPSSFRKDL